jgi:hypothetical protein
VDVESARQQTGTGGPPGEAAAHAHEVAQQILREHPEFGAPHSLEDDESVPPRPEEAIADAVD